jgi:hypothetical protein
VGPVSVTIDLPRETRVVFIVARIEVASVSNQDTSVAIATIYHVLFPPSGGAKVSILIDITYINITYAKFRDYSL